MRYLLAGFLAASGCLGKDESEPPRESTARALKKADDTYVRYLVGASEDLEELSTALLHGATEFHWVRIDVPHASADAVEGDTGLAVELADDDSGLRFAQNYWSVCNPSELLEEHPRCWLRELYTAGEENLSGRVRLRLSGSESLELSYFVEWDGITDRFEGPPSYLRRVTDGSYAVKLEVAP